MLFESEYKSKCNDVFSCKLVIIELINFIDKVHNSKLNVKILLNVV
jgi:hypothetical protein